MQEIIREIRSEEIRVSPFQPRKTFSEEELKELTESILHVGLIHPPVVREVKSKEKTLYYELIAGERRWRASQRAGLEKINVIVRDSSDEQAAKMTLIENVQRVNLNPIEMAEAFKKLIDIFSMTQEELAQKVGKKRSTVANYLRLLALPETIRLSLSTGSITMGHAKAILSLESKELQNKLNDLIIQKEMTVRDAEKESREIVKKKKVSSKTKEDPNVQELKNKIEERFGTKADIVMAKKEGKIILHFYGEEDLENLLDLMQISREI